jgi:hypothetical protein
MFKDFDKYISGKESNGNSAADEPVIAGKTVFLKRSRQFGIAGNGYKNTGSSK